MTFWVIMGNAMNKHKRNTQDFKQTVDYQWVNFILYKFYYFP